MRRIVAACAVSTVCVLAVLSVAGTNRAAAQVKAKAVKTAVAASYGNADAINETELKIYDYYLAADQLEGRNFPSRGYDTAALYVASHLAEWGLKPGGSATGTDGPLQPYFMPIELVAKQIVTAESKASLSAPAPAGRGGGNAAPELRTTNFEYGKDWSSGGAAGFGGGGGRGGAPVEPFDVSGSLVFAGNGYMITKTKTNPYEGLDVHGKIIVVAGLPPELAALQGGGGRGGRGGAPANPLGENCTDFLSPEAYAAKNGALAVVTVANFQQLSAMANPTGGGRGAGLNGPNFQVKKFQQTPTCPVAPSITAGVELTNALFQGEKLNGGQVFYATGSNTRQDSFELSSRKKLSLHVAVHAEPGHGENVVGILEGSDPVLKNEFVVMRDRKSVV